MDIRPVCVACNTKFYVKDSQGKWRLMDVQSAKGTLVSEEYPYQKGIICPECAPKIKQETSI